jgi:hypothetical protein
MSEIALYLCIIKRLMDGFSCDASGIHFTCITTFLHPPSIYRNNLASRYYGMEAVPHYDLALW